jgi:predicted Zn-dependent peptidase
VIKSTAVVTLLATLTACGGKVAPVATAPAPVTTAPAAPPMPPQPEKPMPVAPPPTLTQTAAPQALAFPDEDFRKAQPGPTAPRPFRLPTIKPFTLKSGLKVFLVEQHTLPIVSMDLTFDGGALVDPVGKEGLAAVCMNLLTEGTAQLDKIAYSEALADTASSISAYAGDDSQGLSLASLSKHLDSTFALFVETLRHPGLRASDFERMVKRRIESVKQSKGNPASVAARVSGPVLYGATHPYGTVTTEASLAALTLDDCKAYLGAWLKPKNARLFVVGDLTEAQVRAHFDSPALAGWTGASPKPPALATPQTMKGRIFLVNIPGAAQSQVSLVHFGPKRTAQDYFANTIMASVFGGGFASRLNMNLREDKGYSYGARGGFSYSRAYGTFTASASVRTDATYQSLLEIDREVKALWSAKVPTTKEELEREKAGATLGLPGRFATANAALGQYRGLVYFGLPLDYYNHYVDGVGKVTAAQVRAAAAGQLKPGQAVYVVVGDGDAKVIVRNDQKKDVPLTKDGKQLTLREALTDLAARGDVGAGGLVVLDADGKPVPAGM